MKFLTCLYIVFLPFHLKAQEKPLPRLQLYAGINFSKPLKIPKEIVYQGGNGIEVGLQYHFLQKNNYSLFLSLGTSYRVYNIEGYFTAVNKKDEFVITADNVKANSLILTPASLNFGFQKNLAKRIYASVSVGTIFNNKIKRRYKIAANKFEEDYRFQKKFNFSIDGALGFNLSGKRYRRIDLIAGYSFTSMSATNKFHPVTIGVRYIRGLKN